MAAMEPLGLSALVASPDGAASTIVELLPPRDQLSLLSTCNAAVRSSLRRQCFASLTWEIPPSLPFATALVDKLTVRASITAVSIADPSFQPLLQHFPSLERVRIRGKKDEAPLTKQFPLSVTTIDLRYAMFDDISCLVPLTQMRRLELAFVQASSFAALSGMTQLQELNLWGATIDSVAFVRGTPHLRTLNLRRTDLLFDLDPLASLLELEDLNIAEKQIASLEWIRPLAKSLKVLNARALEVDESPANTVTNSIVLSSLTNLEKLEIQSSNVISSFAPILSLTKLTHLDIIGLELGDLAGLDTLRQLETLSLDADESSDWTALHGLARLRRFNQNGLYVGHPPSADTEVLVDMSRLESLMGAVYLPQQYSLPHLRELSLHCYLLTENEDATAALWCAPNIETLQLSGACNIDNVAKFLPRLRHLHLLSGGGASCFKTSYAPIAQLTCLQTLTLADKSVFAVDGGEDDAAGSSTDRPAGLFSFLMPLVDMEDLYLAGQPFEDVQVLANMHKLRRLNLENTRVKEVAPLRNLLALEELELDGTRVVDVAPLVGHPGLRRLTLPREAICRPLFADYGVTLPAIKEVRHPKHNCLWSQHQDEIVDVSGLFIE